VTVVVTPSGWNDPSTKEHDMAVTTNTSTHDLASLPEHGRGAAERFVRYLETNADPAAVFADDAFCDLVLPMWRLQAESAAGAHALRTGGHPHLGQIEVRRADPTPTGFLVEVRETWTDPEGRTWTCLEAMRADVVDGLITDLVVYCTGDWDEEQVERHGAAVELSRR
jgi:hypothetical protein